MLKEKNILDKLKWRIAEIEKTFSNQPSFYASKRFERALIFINALVLLDVMSIKLLMEVHIDYVAATAIFAAQMCYAGYQTVQIRKDITTKPHIDEK
jgi:hypothetical protein